MCFERTFAPLFLALALATSAPSRAEESTRAPEPAESASVREARELTARARERFEAGDYAAALVEFSRAYELLGADPRRARLLNNIAVCHERLFRYDQALVYYQRYLDEGDPAPEDRAEVEAVIRGLSGLLGKLHVTSNVRAEVWMEGRALGEAPGTLQIPAGSHVLELRAAGHQPERRTIEIVPRALTSAHFRLTPLPEYHGVDRRYFWSGVALTGAALITGAGLGLRALHQYDDDKRLNRQHLLKPGAQDSTQRLALAADIAFGSAALFAVGTTVLGFLTDFRRDRSNAARPRTLRLSTAFEVHGAHLGVSGAWP